VSFTTKLSLDASSVNKHQVGSGTYLKFHLNNQTLEDQPVTKYALQLSARKSAKTYEERDPRVENLLVKASTILL